MPDGEKTATATIAAKNKLKGGRKGGTTFPRINLERALKYSDKLVSKTHTGPLPESTILAGVFDSAGPDGQVRASALKQYGLLQGNKAAYKASPLAQAIDAAVPGEKATLLQKALLSSKLFREIYDTFQDDTVSRAKIRQRAQALKVHPDSSEECTGIFMESAVTAGIGTVNGDSISLLRIGTLADTTTGEPVENEEDKAANDETVETSDYERVAADATQNDRAEPGDRLSPQRSVVNVNLTVDSSSDPEKLEKQLNLLKRFGLV